MKTKLFGLLLIFLIQITSNSCEPIEEETTTSESSGNTSGSSKSNVYVSVFDKATNERLDFTIYIRIEYWENDELKHKNHTHYCEDGGQNYQYNNPDEFYVTKVTSSGYYDWTGKRRANNDHLKFYLNKKP